MFVSKKLLVFISCLSTVTILFAQNFFNKKNYPQNFGNPVKIPISLAGNFGECRPNHFHSGLDVRTNKVENIPIYSIGDGYVSRVKIEEKGFGNAIYINHLNGYTSLYAHLNIFYPELENYIREQQYKNKSWRIDVQFLPHQFPIRKGSFIALSGNTGSSQAPHLHMEIRNTKTEKPLNGLLFYNYNDTKAPIVKKLGIYNTNLSIYEQTPKQIGIVKVGTIYKPTKDTIIVDFDQVGFSIQADDPMEGALGVLGVFEMDMYVDGEAYFGWQLDDIGYEETRYMNAQADYKTKRNGGPWLQMCYKLPNDKLGVYKSFNKKDGRINLQDGQIHEVKIICKDTKGNSSTTRFFVKYNGMNIERKATELFLSGKKNSYDDGNIALNMNEEVLYDDVPKIFSVESNTNPYSNLYNVLRGDIPAHDSFELKLKAKTIPNTLNNKVAIVRHPYGKENTKKGKFAKYKNGWASCFVKDFGKYEIIIDQTPPLLTTKHIQNANMANAKRIVFIAKDETTFIKNFEGKLDGKWVRFVQKGDMFYYEIDKYCSRGATHTIVVKATDDNENTSTQSLNFTY